MSKIYEYDDNHTVGVDSNIPVKITKGAYKGTTFTYGSVSFTENDDSVNCNFEYNILEKPEDLVEDNIFVNQLGEILVDILSEEIEEVENDFLRSGITPKYEDS
tara:strand:- start:409 stop:720 length:312 start_codon:yes stop_codon:yes gene_type:complete